MPLTWKDRIKHAVSAGGTGALTLGAASSGYQAFAAGDNAKLFAYVIEDGTAWETGYGTYTHSGTSFARTSRTASSTGSALTVSTSAFVFVDIVSSIAEGMDLAAQSVAPGGRLTLESGVPISTTDQTAKTTVYYTPFAHNIITLWDGNRWQPVVFAETSLALGTITSDKPYDVFGYLSGGALALELLAWTNGTTRATAVTLQDGRYSKSGDKTRLYLGTFYTTATTTTEDSETKRFLWNAYNRVRRTLRRAETTANWTYTTATTWRSANNSTANRVQTIVGLPGTAISLQLCALFSITSSTAGVVQIGEGSTSSASTSSTTGAFGYIVGTITVLDGPVTVTLNKICDIGYQYWQWLERLDVGSTVTFFGVEGTNNTYRTGLSGFIDG